MAGVTVLLYHRVGGGSRLEIDLPAGLFEEQIAMVAEETRPLALDDALIALAGPSQPEGPPQVVVTFDDGTADFADVALTILQSYRVPATVYVATDHVESGRSFSANGAPLSWAALDAAMATGLVTVGSHTHTHALLDRLPAPLVDDELDRSIGLIADRLGVPPAHFAYPKGLSGSLWAEAAVRCRFRSASLAGTRANPYGRTDPFRLFRSPVQVSDGMRWFGRKLRGGMSLEDDLRALLNRRRYTGITT
ncbi:MAG: polysaccharide deacetylase family protein [Acidimicrobiales bacterium]